MSNIKCFVLSSGVNIISEYEEKESILCSSKKELYFINPMVSDFIQNAQGQVGLTMALLVIFNRIEEVGPINEKSIIFSYELEDKFKSTYENQILKLRAARSGLVQATTMPKIGGGMKIVK
jgi:hypothetical protein